MTFEDLMEIYKEKKEQMDIQGIEEYTFIPEIFDEIEAQYKEDARKRGKDPQMAWNSWSGTNLQKLLGSIVEDYVSDNYPWVGVTDDNELRKVNIDMFLDKVKRNILVFYNECGIVPDADIILYDKRNWQVIAVLSCKASLRERIAQASYWKLKLMGNDNTDNISYFLVSTDKDGDFDKVGSDIHRNRIITEYGELDGAWILRDIPETSKIKRFCRIFKDLDDIFHKWDKKHS